LPEEDFEERLNKNVIDRYSNGDGYLTIAFTSNFKNKEDLEKNKKKRGLLFIKSPFLNNCPSYTNIKSYLQGIKKVINQNLPKITKDGFVVVQTQDVRINGYIEPLAKRITETLSSNNNLWLKEVVVVTPAGENSQNQISKDYLRIAHRYLLVYEVVK